ncbi:MAG: Uma2 family endonuclease, partial [Planctomycetaceae bacterium]|nr:Uma2 family endonuclease [Planctomycetaceae bacterium]
IEVVVSHDANDAVEVYRRIGVPEVWICEATRLTILCLESGGRYAKSERSRVFPVLTAGEIHAWVSRQNNESDTAWTKELRRRVAEVLAPRYRELKQKLATEIEKLEEEAS